MLRNSGKAGGTGDFWVQTHKWDTCGWKCFQAHTLLNQESTHSLSRCDCGKFRDLAGKNRLSAYIGWQAKGLPHRRPKEKSPRRGSSLSADLEIKIKPGWEVTAFACVHSPFNKREEAAFVLRGAESANYFRGRHVNVLCCCGSSEP